MAASVFVIAWLFGFLFIVNGLERSQQLNKGVLTVSKDRKMLFACSLVIYLVLSTVLIVTYLSTS